MTPLQFAALRRFVRTRFGEIAYAEHGEGPAAIFLHGVPLNGYFWRGALDRLADVRRCIAIDLMGLGHTEVDADQDVSFPTQAQMVLAVLERLGIENFDLIGNDSGGAIAQLIAVQVPHRIRSLVLTNCDVHDNWPPPAFMQAFLLAGRGLLADAMHEMVNNIHLARSDLGLGTAYENPEHITPELVQTYIAPLTQSHRRRALLNRYVASMDNAQTVSIERSLKTVRSPSLMIWGTDDVFFPVQWAHWLKDHLGGAATVIEAPGSRLFFCEERPGFFAHTLREHWRDLSSAGTQ